MPRTKNPLSVLLKDPASKLELERLTIEAQSLARKFSLEPKIKARMLDLPCVWYMSSKEEEDELPPYGRGYGSSPKYQCMKHTGLNYKDVPVVAIKAPGAKNPTRVSLLKLVHLRETGWDDDEAIIRVLSDEYTCIQTCGTLDCIKPSHITCDRNIVATGRLYCRKWLRVRDCIKSACFHMPECITDGRFCPINAQNFEIRESRLTDPYIPARYREAPFQAKLRTPEARPLRSDSGSGLDISSTSENSRSVELYYKRVHKRNSDDSETDSSYINPVVWAQEVENRKKRFRNQRKRRADRALKKKEDRKKKLKDKIDSL